MESTPHSALPHRFDWPFVPTRLAPRDALVALLLVGAGFLHATYFIDRARPPFEDAAMLLRYADHLAHGYGIVWNIGEPPVDGATDFLFMVGVAAVAKAGVNVETAAYVLTLGAHLACVAWIYLALRRLAGTPRLLAAFAASYLLLGPGITYVQAAFGATVFALLGAITWSFAIASASAPRRITSAGFALSALLLGLIRPEGVLLGAFMLVAVCVQLIPHGWGACRGPIAWFVGVMGIIGGAYFLWRWHYFGQPLPNPFYKKGHGRLYPDSLIESAQNVLRQVGVFWIFPLLALFVPGRKRALVFTMLPIAAFTLIWVLLSRETNFNGRFQYAVLPIVLIGFPPLGRGAAESWMQERLAALSRNRRCIAVAMAVLFAVTVLAYQARRNRDGGAPDMGIVLVARELAPFAGRGYGIALTEAGRLPLYSGWRALDAWGLNDRTIAHVGHLPAPYLAQFNPHVIMFHAFFTPLAPAVGKADEWQQMCLELQGYADANHYELAAAWGPSPAEAHYYYVRRDFPDSAHIIALIRGTRYTWWGSNEPCREMRPFASPRAGD